MVKAAVCLLALAVLVGASSPASAQANFNGDWELVDGIADSPLFRAARIGQTAETVTLEPTPPQRLFEAPRVFRLDGTETLYTHGNVRGDETWTLASRAHWTNGTLRITTITTRSGVQTGSWESSMTMSVDENGRLVIVKNEPTLTGTIATMRAVYRRK